mmetsp:Transcript_51000/g.150333  ORF Transcript_51000/g.150333 Transcript_51000/m.150333 type:complete len:216 (+) Transcript_51000:1908-2555(+)
MNPACPLSTCWRNCEAPSPMSMKPSLSSRISQSPSLWPWTTSLWDFVSSTLEAMSGASLTLRPRSVTTFQSWTAAPIVVAASLPALMAWVSEPQTVSPGYLKLDSMESGSSAEGLTRMTPTNSPESAMSCASSQPSTLFRMPTATWSFGSGTPKRRNLPSSVRSMKHFECSWPKSQSPTIWPASTLSTCVASFAASSVTTNGVAVMVCCIMPFSW